MRHEAEALKCGARSMAAENFDAKGYRL